MTFLAVLQVQCVCVWGGGGGGGACVYVTESRSWYVRALPCMCIDKSLHQMTHTEFHPNYFEYVGLLVHCFSLVHYFPSFFIGFSTPLYDPNSIIMLLLFVFLHRAVLHQIPYAPLSVSFAFPFSCTSAERVQR